MDNFRFLLLCEKSSYSVYKDTDEAPEPLRHVSGAHSDTCLIRADSHFSLVVTGTIRGEVGVWDFETSMLLAYLLGHTDSITDVVFLSPYPLILTTSLDGLICVWKIKPYECIYRF